MKRTIPNGFLIAIEGIDGAGKTTHAVLLAKHLESQGFEVVLSKEPTAGKWGRILRESAVTGRLSPEEELETFLKDRQEHVETVIQPALKSGKVVILDRYFFSTLAYQGARGLDLKEILRRNEEVAPPPDLLILIDVDPAVGRSRIHERGDRSNLFETNGQLARAREIFLSLDRPYLCRLDGNRSVEEIQKQIQLEFARRAAGKIGSAAPTLDPLGSRP